MEIALNRKVTEVTNLSSTTLRPLVAMSKGGSEEEPLAPLELREAFGSDIVVIAPGSTTVAIGRASDRAPHLVPQVCAVKTDRAVKEHESEMEVFRLPEDTSQRRKEAWEELQAHHHWAARPDKGGVTTSSGDSAVPESPMETLLTGEKALEAELRDGYELRRPLAGGRINATRGHRAHEALSELTEVWRNALGSKVGLQSEDMARMKCALIVGQRASYTDISRMVDVALSLGFSKCVVHRDSVAASFGLGSLTAASVCIDSHYCSAICTEDGAEIPSTRRVCPFGKEHVARCLQWLASECSSWPPADGPLPDRCCADLKRLHVLVDSCVAFPVEGHELRPARATVSTADGKEHELEVGTLGAVAGWGLFDPRLLCADELAEWERTQRLCLDHTGEASAMAAMTSVGGTTGLRQQQKEKEQAQCEQRDHGHPALPGQDVAEDGGEEGAVEAEDEGAQEGGLADEKDADTAKWTGEAESPYLTGNDSLAKAVVRSIISAGPSVYEKLSGSVVVYGEGANMRGLMEALEERVLADLPDDPVRPCLFRPFTGRQMPTNCSFCLPVMKKAGF